MSKTLIQLNILVDNGTYSKHFPELVVNYLLLFPGQAIAQLDVNWGVDYEPFKDHPARDCFNLTIQEYFHGRNKSEITIKSCFSWTLTEESPTSGMAMLVVDIPSGYIMLQPGTIKKIIFTFKCCKNAKLCSLRNIFISFDLLLYF